MVSISNVFFYIFSNGDALQLRIRIKYFVLSVIDGDTVRASNVAPMGHQVFNVFVDLVTLYCHDLIPIYTSYIAIEAYVLKAILTYCAYRCIYSIIPLTRHACFHCAIVMFGCCIFLFVCVLSCLLCTPIPFCAYLICFTFIKNNQMYLTVCLCAGYHNHIRTYSI